jgi:hypothetical protein
MNKSLDRVARWFVFEPKIPIWVNFGGPWNGKCGYDHLEYISTIWYYLWPFCIFLTFWYVWTKKNLATLLGLFNLAEN